MTPTPEELQVCWNQNRGEMLEWRSLEVLGRRKLALLRLSETPDLRRWAVAIRRAAASDFCTGKVLKDGDGEPFIAGPDWLLKPETLVLIEEGKFDTRVDLPLPDAQRSPADLSHFNLEKDIRKLTEEEVRRARICGLAVKAWERERREWYGQKRNKRGERIGDDPRETLTNWISGETQTVPGLVVNYGPPLNTPIETLEEWMYLRHMPWRGEKEGPKPLSKEESRKRKDKLARQAVEILRRKQGASPTDEAPF